MTIVSFEKSFVWMSLRWKENARENGVDGYDLVMYINVPNGLLK